MNDREIYNEVGSILYSGSPRPEQENHIHACIWPKQAVDMTMWFGKFRSKDSNFALPIESTSKISDLFLSLHDYYVDHGMGKWNLVHFILAPNGESFNIDFEFNKEKEEGKLILWRYRLKFDEENA